MATNNNYSLTEVVRFLENARDSKCLKFNTARTRITALRKLRSFLSNHEQQDLRTIDKNALTKRLRDEGGINEGTIQTYLTRLDKSISAYESLNPILKEKGSLGKHVIQSEETPKQIERITLVIAIDDSNVKISNLPTELTNEHAERICMAVKEFVKDV